MKVVNLVKSFDEQIILDNINLSIENKGLYLIYGESGAGKSTLFNIITNQTEVDSGTIDYENNSISFCSSQNKLIEILSPLESFRLVSNDKTKINKYIKEFALEEVKNKKNIKLSSGERERVQLILTLLSNADILLFDEPTANLDKETSIKTYELIKEESFNRAIVVVSHDVNNISSFVDAKYLLKDHKLNCEFDNTSLKLNNTELTSLSKKGLSIYALKSNLYHPIFGALNLILMLFIFYLFSCLTAYLNVDPRKNAEDLSVNLKYELVCGKVIKDDTFDKRTYLENNKCYNYVSLVYGFSHSTHVHALIYEEVNDDLKINMPLDKDDCIISKKLLDELNQSYNKKYKIGDTIVFNSFSHSNKEAKFKIAGFYESEKYSSKNNIIYISEAYLDSLMDDSLYSQEISSYLNSLIVASNHSTEFDFIDSNNNLLNFDDVKYKNYKDIDLNYTGLVFAGKIPENEHEIVTGNIYNYIGFTDDRLNDSIFYEQCSNTTVYPYLGLSSTLKGNYFGDYLNGRKVNDLNIVGTIFYCINGKIIDDNSLHCNYLYGDLYEEMYNSKLDSQILLLSEPDSFYFQKDVYTTNYDEILNNKLYIELNDNRILFNEQTVKSMITSTSVFTVIMILIRLLYQSLLFDNLKDDFDKLKYINLTSKDKSFVLMIKNVLSFIICLVGTIIGIMCVNLSFKREVKYMSNGSWVANYPLIIIFDIILGIMIVLLTFIPYFIKKKKVNRKWEEYI